LAGQHAVACHIYTTCDNNFVDFEGVASAHDFVDFEGVARATPQKATKSALAGVLLYNKYLFDRLFRRLFRCLDYWIHALIYCYLHVYIKIDIKN
jgi:hypothetical protein